jgi:HD superfamily phosphohydrolase YqeK
MGYARSVQTYTVGNTAPLALKRAHTFAVLRRARRIAAAAGFSPALQRAAWLAALYHDIARFEQYARWHTFKDSLSVNHGLYGALLLPILGFLREEDEATQALVVQAVRLHNVHTLPHDLSDELRLLVCCTRDADKLDIMRVMDAHFSRPSLDPTVVLAVADEPEKYSPAIAELALQGRFPDYKDLHFVNDFKLLLGTWLYDMSFPSSLIMLAEEGHFEHILASLPCDALVQQARHSLLAALAAKVAQARQVL